MIAVVIPAYNAERTIAQSLRAVLSQEYLPNQVIVVDNNSTDRTVEEVKKVAETIERPQIIVTSEATIGPSAARNRGFELAEEEIVVFMDADMLPEKDWLKNIKNEFDGGAKVITGPCISPFSKTIFERYLAADTMSSLGKREIFKEDILNERILRGANCAFRRDVLSKVGGFNEKMRLGEDRELSQRIYHAGIDIVYNPRIAIVHYNNETFRSRFDKCFTYGEIQMMLFKQYFKKQIIVHMPPICTLRCKKTHLKIFVHCFSPLKIGAFLGIVGTLSISLGLCMLLVLLGLFYLCIRRMFGKAKVNIHWSEVFVVMWYYVIERLLSELGRMYGMLKYKVICL